MCSLQTMFLNISEAEMYNLWTYLDNSEYLSTSLHVSESL